MKKKIIIFLSTAFLITTIVTAWAIYTSFSTVKPATEKIDKGLETVFSKIVRIPTEMIPRPSRDFSQISYLWEMETLDKEVIEVRFSYTPSYTSDDKEVIAILEMTEKGDPSIFDKVMPALVADEQSLNSARDPQKANFGPNEKALYSKLAITKDLRGDKTVKITWIYNKDKMSESFKEEYQKIAKYPRSILQIFYSIPSFLVNLVKG